VRAKTRERYRVYTEDEFFATEGLIAAAEHGVGEECGPDAGKSGMPIDGKRAYGARRAASVAMLVGTVGAVIVVLAIDVLPHAGGSRRRGASLRVARVAAHGTSVGARPLSRVRLPRALARQSRRGGRSARPARERVISTGPHPQVNRAPQAEVAASRPAGVSAERGEVARAELAAASEVPVRSRPEEFGFER
jgi:hypothetical protein